jgi:pyruvate formate lyase activating enzyme
MIISGLTPLSLIDYPGKVACVIFTQGCNFRCPFCHNPELLECMKSTEHDMSTERFFEFLESRVGLLDGVVITGGEPTLHRDLDEFMTHIKSLGFLVKLDSNGTNPQLLKQYIEAQLVDYIAMDIKHKLSKYEQATGRKTRMEWIQESIDLVLSSGVPHEFRTTVVPGIHAPEDFYEISDIVDGCDRFYLQEFRPIITFDSELKHNHDKLDLDWIKRECFQGKENVMIRR